MRFTATLIFATCLTATGCLTPGRDRDRDRERERGRDDRDAINRKDDPNWWLDGTSNSGRNKIASSAGRTSDREGIVAGEVFDHREGRRLTGATYIAIRPADEAAPVNGKGIGVETDADGYFYVPGLVPGRSYILTAVREIGGRKVAGEAIVRPPASNLRIDVSENKVSSVTPPPLPPVGHSGPFADTKLPDPPPPAAPESNRTAESGWGPGALPPPPYTGPRRPENVAVGELNVPPSASIRPPPPAIGPSRKPNDTPPPARSAAGRVPNFIVSDVTGADWEYRYASGRLVLLDFWSTTCIPCLKAVPNLKRIQSDYGASGLEVVAVALEADAPFAIRAKEVDQVARRKEVNYRVYLERDGRSGEIARMFNVQMVPTFVLMDRLGNVLWRGGASEAEFNQLEDRIRTYLTRRD